MMGWSPPHLRRREVRKGPYLTIVGLIVDDRAAEVRTQPEGQHSVRMQEVELHCIWQAKCTMHP